MSRHQLSEGVTPQRSALMSRVRRRDTPAELVVRRVLHAVGGRFRVNVGGLPGSPDIANRAKRRVIFVHGCFWHRHPGCVRTTLPRKNRAFWTAKFADNVRRDRRKEEELRARGFEVLTIWECEVRDPGLADRVRDFWFGETGA